jgi:hypothetical protein
VAEILKMLELAEDHGVPQMKVGGRGVHAKIDAERFAGFMGILEFGDELSFGDNFGDAFFEVGELFDDGFEVRVGHEMFSV